MSVVIIGKHDEYKLYKDKKLGKGGFATVFKGINTRTKEEVAIKHITERVDYGLREAKKMEELSKDRDNIYTVKLLDYKKSSKELFLILPYYEHGSLQDYIQKNGKLSLEMNCSMFGLFASR
uniref:Protein kinase domain-containing protein n=1 Tax=Panagrolaimus davidi TaxID=227884 RepID=A0A914QHD2_9BILA